jgi:Flp pilus assembly protein TadG
MRTRPDRLRSTTRGTAAVEFALVLPLVLVVALALVQTGLLVRDRLLLEAAVRAGARAAAIQEDDTEIRNAALSAAPGLDPSALDLAVRREGARGDPVTVSVRYTGRVRIPFVSWLFGGSLAMSTAATARQEFG